MTIQLSRLAQWKLDYMNEVYNHGRGADWVYRPSKEIEHCDGEWFGLVKKIEMTDLDGNKTEGSARLF